MKKRIASMLAATVLLLSVIALPASAQTDWFGNSDLTTAKVREIADADTLTESQIAEINNHYSEYEIMQGISKTLIEDYAARINPDNPPHCAVCAGFDDLYLHYIDMFTFGLDMMDQIMTSKEDMTTLSSKELLGGIRHS